MMFTYPVFLWALTALAIPIIIHLFHFRKVKKVAFSHVRFLESVQKKTSSRRRIKHLLVLFCRLLFLLFLVLAFAQPFLPSEDQGLSHPSVVIYIDNSYSMSNTTAEDWSGLNQALALAREIIALYPAETEFRIITNDFDPDEQNKSAKKQALERLTEIDYAYTSRLGHELFRQLPDGSPSALPSDIFIISDFQKSTFGQLAPPQDSLNAYYLLPVAFAEKQNVYIDSVYLDKPFLIPQQKNLLTVRLKNEGERTKDFSVKLYINDKQLGLTTLALAANADGQTTFRLPNDLLPLNRCRISVEDFPITFDNEYYFTLQPAAGIQIVELTDTPSHSVSPVYEDHALFDLHSYGRGNIDYGVLNDADLVILNELKSIDEGLAQSIHIHLAEGRSVLFIPAADWMPQDEDRYEIAQVRLTKNDTTPPVSIEIPNPQHPFFENIFEAMPSQARMPSATCLYQWHASDLPLLKIKTGLSFLSQLYAKGQLYLFASPLTSAFTNLRTHALFVPIMQRIAERSIRRSPALAYSMDQTQISLPLDSLPQQKQGYKLKQEDLELIPSQRIADHRLHLDLPPYLVASGFYDLKLGDARVGILSFNTAKRESRLATRPVEALQADLAPIKQLHLFESPTPDTFSKQMKAKYQRRALWKYALALSLIFIFAEGMILRFFK